MSDDGQHVDLAMDSDDEQASVRVIGDTGNTLPETLRVSTHSLRHQHFSKADASATP